MLWLARLGLTKPVLGQGVASVKSNASDDHLTRLGLLAGDALVRQRAEVPVGGTGCLTERGVVCVFQRRLLGRYSPGAAGFRGRMFWGTRAFDDPNLIRRLVA